MKLVIHGRTYEGNEFTTKSVTVDGITFNTTNEYYGANYITSTHRDGIKKTVGLITPKEEDLMPIKFFGFLTVSGHGIYGRTSEIREGDGYYGYICIHNEEEGQKPRYDNFKLFTSKSAAVNYLEELSNIYSTKRHCAYCGYEEPEPDN